ncbi:unnamed protein product [Ambrosiozyma monospora]|uniref:Unnamed protein product n=1 Tax=Ambrosiozyma monospora TaxID=43982 RepID=A0ACB5SUX1_AMBMO|nr:unnamed protein product [Ambrosiozyma monospora]
MRINNLLGFAKVVFLLFVVATGFAALTGNTRAPKDLSVFKDGWKGTTNDANAISNTVLKVVFSMGGTQYIFGVVAETNPRNTIKTYKYFVPLTLSAIFVIYMLVITAYYAGIQDIDEIKDGGNLISALYFEKIFQTKASVQAMCAFVALSAFGHLIAVFISHSRSLRECGRQGVLPYPRLWTSVKPWGTPLFPILITLIVNLIVLLIPPPGDAYNFVVDMGAYSGYIFNSLLIIGLFKLRKDRRERGLTYREFKCPTFLLFVLLLWSIFVLVMAFVPPKDSWVGSDVSLFYALYAIATIVLFGLCILYYFAWSKVLPRIGGYSYRIGEYTLPSGEKGHTVVKVKNSELEQWDAEHESLQGAGLSSGGFGEEELPPSEVYVVSELDGDSSSGHSGSDSDSKLGQSKKIHYGAITTSDDS